MRSLFFFVLFALLPSIASTQNFWRDVDIDLQKSQTPERWITPDKYRSTTWDFEDFKSSLAQAPERNNPQGGSLIIHLPAPDDQVESFRIQYAPIMETRLASKYPRIRTFTGVGIEDPSARIFFDFTPKGIHAMVLKPGASYFIDPIYDNQTELYQSYYKSDLAPREDLAWACHLQTDENQLEEKNDKSIDGKGIKTSKSSDAVTLLTYNIAIAATGEYTTFHGGTVELGMAAIVTALNRVRGIYENDVAVSFVLNENNDQIVYTDGATDPYTNNSGGTMLGQNQTNLDAVIGSANYDIGHVFSTGGGGVASLGVVCNNTSKARGVTGLGNPIGDPFYVDYVAHEMGHQYGGSHTFNGTAGSCCCGNRSALSAYEPGSGSTIQAYAGICGSQNLQNNSDAYFHLRSLNQITAHITMQSGATCPDETVLANEIPVSNADFEGMDGKTIPIGTPFELTGQGTDAQGGTMTYNWEQWDLGPGGALNANSVTAPMFRSFTPNTSATRIFPGLDHILENTTPDGEVLPNVTRDLNFQFIVRDNFTGGGGFDSDPILIKVSADAGPFSVTSQNTSETIAGDITVTWDVADTDMAPVSCPNVDILLSTNGGSIFDNELAASTDNDGSQMVTVPADLHSNDARIKVKCSNNVFFDINDADLTIGNVMGDCMTTNLEVDDDPIADGLYKSGDAIFSSGVVQQNSTVIFEVDTFGELEIDFTVHQPAAFTILVDPCN